MKLAIKLNKKDVVINVVYDAQEDYTRLLDDDNTYKIIDVESGFGIVPYKFEFKNDTLIELDDYTQEYYDMQNREFQKMLLNSQLTELYLWFDAYDMQVKQYERNTRLGIESTYHIGDEEFTIEELDDRAIDKANQIKELRKQIEEINNPIIDDSSEE